MQKFLRRLERFSQSLLSPLSYLSAAGLLLVLGALLTSKPLCQALPVLQWAPLQLVGQLLYNGMMVLINNLSVILCVGVAAVRAKTEKQDAALLALMAYLVFLTANHTALEALGLLAQPNGMTGLAGTGQTTILGIQVVDTGVASGIVLGFAAAWLFNRTCEKQFYGMITQLYSGLRWSFLWLSALAVALGSLAAACLYPGERLRCAGVFAAGCVLGALAAPDAAGVLPLFVAGAVGLGAALAVPGAWLRVVFPPPAPPVQTQGLSGAARRLAGVADTLSDIADTVNAVCTRQMPPKGENFDFVVEHIARTTCQTCTRRSRCWVRGYATAMDGLYQLKPTLESRGRVEVEDLPGQLSVCIHPADLCTAANHGYRLWRSRRQTRARASMLRTALTEQYSAMAGALAQLAGKLGQAGLPDPRREEKVAQLFAGLGLDALECSVTSDLAGRLTAAVTIARTRFTEEEIKALTAEVSRICRRDMDLPEVTHCRTVTMLTFGERPLFTATFGTAGRPAKGQNVSGDALDCFCDTSGRAQLLLCDGMGTGRAAAVDGQMAARLTGQLLRAGFAAESAARLVNVALGLKSAEQESGATLDLLTVDLYTGRAGLFKAGAAPSFLVRGGLPRMLEGASLPMGVLESLVGRSTTFALDSGDWVVLVSDGALTDGTEWLTQQLQLCARLGHTPQQAAETIADAAARRAGEKQDDITVAVFALGKAG